MMVKPSHAYAIDRSHPLTRGLVGAWFFTETSGLSCYDISGYENHGTRGGFAANTGFAGGPNGILQDFNESNGAGADVRIDCGTKAVLTDMTEFTFIGRIFPKTTGRGTGARLFSKHTVKNFNISVNTSNNIDLSITRASVNALARSANNTVEMNVWQTYAGRYNGTDGPRIYKAKEFGRFAEVSYASRTTGSGADSADGSGNFILGNRPATDRPLDGLYDWALIFNRFLTLEELQAIHERPFALIARPQNVLFWNVSTGSVTGTAATTNANDTAAASGTTQILGASATTNAADASAASGTTRILGTSATTNANDAGEAEGTTAVTGASATTNAHDTAAAAGSVPANGTVAYTNANDTASAIGTTTIKGAAAVTNGADSSTAQGVSGIPTVDGGGGGPKRRRQTKSWDQRERERQAELAANRATIEARERREMYGDLPPALEKALAESPKAAPVAAKTKPLSPHDMREYERVRLHSDDEEAMALILGLL